MEDKKDPYYLVCTDWRKKPENVVKEYVKRFWIEEKHRRDKSLKLEGNYLRSERSNNGFILLMAHVESSSTGKADRKRLLHSHLPQHHKFYSNTVWWMRI